MYKFPQNGYLNISTLRTLTVGVKALLSATKMPFILLFIGLLSLTSSCGWWPVTPGWSRSSTLVCGSRRSWLSWCWSSWCWISCVSTCWAPLRSPPDHLSDLCSADVQRRPLVGPQSPSWGTQTSYAPAAGRNARIRDLQCKLLQRYYRNRGSLIRHFWVKKKNKNTLLVVGY